MHVEIAPLYEGTFSVGTDKRFHRIARTEPAAKGALKLSLNPFLIKIRGAGNGDGVSRNILIDCGLGDYGQESHIPVLYENLAQHGLTEHDITDIVCSHLHWDHVGGLAHRQKGYRDLTFPDAKIWLSGQEWEKIHITHDDEDMKSEFMHFLEARADLNFLYDGDEPIGGLQVRVIGGHTEFSLGLFMDFGSVRLVMAGDVLGTKGAINRRYAANYDFDGKKSQALRHEITQFAFDNDYWLLCYHDNDMPVIRFTGKRETTGYEFEPAL